MVRCLGVLGRDLPSEIWEATGVPVKWVVRLEELPSWGRWLHDWVLQNPTRAPA